MPDRILMRWVGVIAVLNAFHTVDHVLRGDFHWPIDGPTVVFVTIITTIYGVLGVGAALYRRERVGPLFWIVIGLLGLGFGWLSHFSPVTEQPVRVIFSAYQSAVAGTLAVACLIALMLAVLAATVRAASLWRRLRRGPAAD